MANDKNFKVKNGIDSGGVITSPGGSSSNWNTAFSWGNHAGLYAFLEHEHDYLPLDGGTLTGALNFGNGVYAQFGANQDLKIGHSGATSYIQDVGTGNLFISTNGASINLRGGNDNNDMAVFTSNGGVQLNYGGAARFSVGEVANTSNVDLNVTGEVTATDGNSTNWNTAYGWGDHATAGYLTSVSGYLPLAGGTLTGELTTDDIVVPAGKRLKFGEALTPNFEIYASGTATVLHEQGAGNIEFIGDNMIFRNPNSGTDIDYYAKFTYNGSTALYFDGTKVFETTATGIDVTGTVTATGGNSTNWNTAYGWGDHASAGYYLASNPNGYTDDQTAAEILTAIKTVDGSGSGLDADLLDGAHKVDIQKELVNVTSPVVTVADSCLPSTGYGFKHFLGLGPSNNDGHILGMTWTNTASYGAQIFVDTDPTNTMAFRSRGSTGDWTSWNTVWHTGNDGSDSGLDADLLDGQEGSYYAPNSSLGSYLPLAGGTLTGTLAMGANAITSTGTISSGAITASAASTFQGEASNGGTINIGNTAAYRGIISYTGANSTTLSFASSYDDANARIDFNLRTAGTAVTALRLLGSGNATFGGTISSGAITSTGNIKITTNGNLLEIADAPIQWYSAQTSDYKIASMRAASYNLKGSGNSSILIANNNGISVTGSVSSTTTGSFTGNVTANGVTIGASDIRSSSNILTLGGTSECLRIDANGHLRFMSQGAGTQNNSSINNHTNNYMYFMGGSSGAMYQADNSGVVRLRLNSTTLALETASTPRINIAADGLTTLSGVTTISSGYLNVNNGGGGQISLGDYTNSVPIGISEGLWDTVGSDNDYLSVYARSSFNIRGYAGGTTHWLAMTGSNFDLVASQNLQIGGITVIDSSRNLTNIGTISSGAHTIYTQASTLEGINLVANVSSANQNSDSPKIQFNGEYQDNGPYIQGDNVGSYGYKSLKFYTNRNSGTDYTTAPTVTLTLDSNGNAQFSNNVSAASGIFQGNVGIGVTEPSKPLDISGGMRASGSGTQFNSGFATGTAVQINASSTDNSDGLQVVRGAGSNQGSGLLVTSANYTTGSKAHIELNAGIYGGSSTQYLHAYDNTSTKFLMRGDGAMGILTDSPTAQLDVRGNVRIGDGTSSEQDILFSAGSGEWQVGTNSAGNGTNNNQFYVFDSTYRFTVQKGTGNVGISTDQPTNRFHVKYNVNATIANLAEVNDYSAVRIGNFRADGDHNLYIGYMASNSVGLQARDSTASGTAQNILINPYGGLVGIGTTAPSDKLHVIGNTKIEQTSNVDAILRLNPNSGTIGSNYRWELVGRNSAENYNFQIREGATPYLTINSSIGGGAGNVGIGTTAPTSKLDVNSTAYVNTDSTQALRFTYNGSPRAMISAYGGEGELSLYRSSNAKNIYISSYYDSYFNGGNVGIGTTTPTAKIHATTATAGYTAKLINTNGASDANGLLIQAGTVGTEYALNVTNTAGSSNYLVVKGDGNVGIGTSSPAAKLHATGTFGTTLTSGIRLDGLGVTTNNLAPIAFYTQSSNWGTQHAANIAAAQADGADGGAYLRFSTSPDGNTAPAERVRIESNGTVKIGTYGGAQELMFRAAQDSTSTIRFNDNNDSEGTYIRAVGQTYGGDIKFGARWDDDEDKMIIRTLQSSAGGAYDVRVGIGTVTPSNTLEVNGGTTIGGQLRVNTSNWPTNMFGDSAGRHIFGGSNEPLVVLWNEASAASGNESTFAIGAKTGAGATTFGGAFIRGGIENSSDTEGYFETYITYAGGTNFRAQYIDAVGNFTQQTQGYNANRRFKFQNGANNPVPVAYDTFVVTSHDVPCISIVEATSGDQSTEQQLKLAVGDNDAVISTSGTVTGGLHLRVGRGTNQAGYLKTNGNAGIHIENGGAVNIGGTSGVKTTIKNTLNLEGWATTGGQSRDTAIYIGRDGTATSAEYFTMGFKTTARSGEQIHPTTGPYNGGTALYIECGSSEAGGICLDEDSVHVYGSSDSGATFRVIDKDADVVTFEMLQTSWNGVFRGDVIAYGSMSSISDRRIKTDIKPIGSVLDKINKLGVYSYKKITAPHDREEIGVIAQEMQEQFPELVNETEVSNPSEVNGLESILTVDYEHLTAVLLKGMQEQQQQINNLTKIIEEIKNGND